jgi:hypothetical protein
VLRPGLLNSTTTGDTERKREANRMGKVRRAVIAVVLTAGTLLAGALTGCAAPQQSPHYAAVSSTGPTIPAPSTSTPPSATTGANPTGGGRGGGRATATAVDLPADWPADLPVPPGTITGSTGSTGQWTVQILAAGSAADVHQSVDAFYTAAGFTAVTDSVLNRGNRQITLLVQNQDHSAAQTTLLIQVSTR